MSLIEYPAAPLSAPTTRRRALYPMMHPEPVLVPVVDTNALLVMGCDMVLKGKQEDLLSGLAGTGRATPYIAAHVPAEIDRHLPRLARRYQVPESEVRRLLDEVVLPSARLVELEIRDHLAPGAKQIMHVDRDLPKQWWGDPDDVPTMALAEFLAPPSSSPRTVSSPVSVSPPRSGFGSRKTCCAWSASRPISRTPPW
ncbi:hypothetical protein ACF09H_41205 [Streptomyces sp. NPDC014983]|uniref:hypothetical protein n=1 Tax=Streptomyces sp. NPDC014983 TaxID=3364933 RepID=UPI0036FD9F03